MKRFTYILRKRDKLTNDVFLYGFDVVEEGFSYVPGQFVTLALTKPTTNETLSRAYSIAGSIDGHVQSSWLVSTRYFELIIRHVPDGRGTTILSTLPLGSQMSGYAPMGALTLNKLDNIDRPIIFCASSTGIAPFRSILQYMQSCGNYANIEVFWGLRKISDIFMFDELMQFEKIWKDNGHSLQINICLSQETQIPTDFKDGSTHLKLGRVNLSFPTLNQKAYGVLICGGKEFVIDTQSYFNQHLPDSQVIVERFN